MDKKRAFQILIFFGKDEKIAHSFLESKGITNDEIAELLELGYIIPVGVAEKNSAYNEDNIQYTITEEGKEARDS